MTNHERDLDARLGRLLAGLALGCAGVLAAAGVYAETHRVPDQP